jgi:hexulose-6-phosphate isomerase
VGEKIMKALTRREMLRVAGVTLSAGALHTSPGNARAPLAGEAKRRFKKCLKFSMVKEDGLSIAERFRLLKDLGFNGVEMDSPNEMNGQEIVGARDETGLEIPGVIDSVHWRETLSDPDPAIRAAGVAGLRTAISDAKLYGASTVLLVPAVVKKSISYEDAYRRSQAEIRRVLPFAEENGIKIAIENVWNGFLLSPLEMARYIDEFESEWIGAYFDIGNIVNFGWPEHWIRILGHRVIKLDIKEYSREKRDSEGPYAGFKVKLGEGDCDWPAVREALEEIEYSGWASAEVEGGGRDRLQEISLRMDRILALGG